MSKVNHLNKTLLCVALFGLSLNAIADNDISTLDFSSKSEFKKFGETVINVLGHKQLFPAEQLGLLGFDVGVSLNAVDTKYKLDSQASKNDTVGVYSVHANKGLPGGFDVAFNYNILNNSDATSWSGELKYALTEGGTANPAMAVSGHYSQSSGIKALDFTSYGVDLGVSKGFANLTPYLGIGYLHSDIDPRVANIQSGVSLNKQSIGLVTYNAGVNINLMVMDILVGYNQIGDLGTYSLKAGYRF